MISTLTHKITDQEPKRQIMRAAMAHALSAKIIAAAMEQAAPQEIEALFTSAGGTIHQIAPVTPATVHLHGIEEYHTTQAHLAIYFWAERAVELARHMEITDPLSLFAVLWRDAPLDTLSDTIRNFCDDGMGSFTTPPAGQNRTGTHLFEIDFLDVTATGHDALEAAKNWRTAAIWTVLAKEAA